MNSKFAGILTATALFVLSFQSVQAGDPTDLRGKRYGEVLLGKGGLIVPKELEVYNSTGLNDCPDALWSKLDPKKIKQDTGAKIVKLNGFMQSFSVQKQNQTVDSLSSLGKRLSLPAGWQYRTLKLSRDFELPAEGGFAYVVQDNFANTYQKSSARPGDSL